MKFRESSGEGFVRTQPEVCRGRIQSATVVQDHFLNFRTAAGATPGRSAEFVRSGAASRGSTCCRLTFSYERGCGARDTQVAGARPATTRSWSSHAFSMAAPLAVLSNTHHTWSAVVLPMVAASVAMAFSP